MKCTVNPWRKWRLEYTPSWQRQCHGNNEHRLPCRWKNCSMNWHTMYDGRTWQDRKTASLIGKSDIARDITKKLIPTALVPPRLFGLPKIHKENVLLRPAVNCTVSPTCLLVQHLARLGSPPAELKEHLIKNSASFSETANSKSTEEQYTG
jgi:hypothetical protein